MTIEANVWSFLTALAPALLAGGAWLQGYLNRRAARRIELVSQSSHKLINQRFTDLEKENIALRETLAALRIERDGATIASAAQASAILDAAEHAKAILAMAAREAAEFLERRARELANPPPEGRA